MIVYLSLTNHDDVIICWCRLQEILQGMTWFNEILEKHKSIRFPLAYLGLGRAFHRQNRFTEATLPLGKGVAIIKKQVTYSVITWPGTQTVIEETKPGMMMVGYERMDNYNVLV